MLDIESGVVRITEHEVKYFTHFGKDYYKTYL